MEARSMVNTLGNFIRFTICSSFLLGMRIIITSLILWIMVSGFLTCFRPKTSEPHSPNYGLSIQTEPNHCRLPLQPPPAPFSLKETCMLCRLVSSLSVELVMFISKLGKQWVTEPKAPKTKGPNLNSSSVTWSL